MSALATAAKTAIKMLSTGTKKSATYAAKGPVDMPTKATGKISKAKGKGAKRENELKHMDKGSSSTYRNMMEKGVKKQKDRTKMLKRSKKPGMSKEYKQRQEWQKRLSNMKRQMMKQGHSKELAQEIGELQQKIDKSYK